MSALLFALTGCIPHLYTDSAVPWTWEVPDNSWGVGAPPDGLLGEGYFVGEVIPDLRGLDRFGDEVSLWQFYGDLVVLDVSSMWCAPCRDLARGVEETAELYHDQGVTYLTLMGEDMEGEPATPEVCAEWADAFGISQPVITDPLEARKDIVSDNAYPRVMIIGRDLRVEIEEIETPTDPKIRSVLGGLL